jgi:CBS-domain-containing membrane protein
MKVQDIMTREVLTIGPEASIRDVAAVLVEHGISGLPVCDEQRRVIGVLSEGDILFKEHDPTVRRGGPLSWLVEGTSRKSIVKARAQTAREAMTAPAVTISPYRGVQEAARLMVEHGVNRLPVVRGDELVGIVTRADLVRAFTRPDKEIEGEIREDVIERNLWLEPGTVKLEVERGHVKLAGKLHAKSDAKLLERLTTRVTGVVSVESALTWNVDDTGRKAMRAIKAG